MYLSFIEDEKDELAQRLEKLEELESNFEVECDSILEEIKTQIEIMTANAIDTLFEEAGITDNYYDEKTQEAKDAMVEHIERHI